MKNLAFGSALILGLMFTACQSETTIEDGTQTEEGAEESQESTAMTCKELLDQKDDLKGKEVTIKAISWGNSNMMGGDVRMNLGDEKLEGMQQAHVVADFSKDNASAAESVKQDDEVTIKATVGDYEYGAVKLLNPEVL